MNKITTILSVALIVTFVLVGCASTENFDERNLPNNGNSQETGNNDNYNVIDDTMADGADDGSQQGSESMNDGTNTNSEDIMQAKETSEVEQQQEQLAMLIADGIYEDTLTYQHHEGSASFLLKLEVENDVIKSLLLETVNADSISDKYIGKVNDELQILSVGKSISEVQDLPSQISGSSLTTKAFKDHVAKLIEVY